MIFGNDRMPSRVVAFASIVLTTTTFCFGQGYWKREFGGGTSIPVSATAQTTGGNIITMVVGGYNSKAVIFIYCVKPNGDTLWAKFPEQQHADSSISAVSSITTLADGGFMVVGSMAIGSYEYISVLKISQNGDILWKKAPSRILTSYDFNYSITATADSNFLVAGTLYDTMVGNDRPFLLKINSDADPLWTKTYGTNSGGSAHKILQTRDGNFLVVGSNIMKINPNGDTIWTKTYGPNSYNDIILSQDGNFIVVGTNVMKISPNGDTLWTNSSLSGSGYMGPFVAIASTRDANYLMAGGSYYVRGLTKIQTDGKIVWSIPRFAETGYGASGALNILPLADGNFAVSAYGGYRTSVVIFWNYIFSVIDDRYAYKSIPFTFTIPGSDDSLLRTYTPVKTPSGMTVSKGGTISWMPQTDSVYMEHVAFLVKKDSTVNDSLTFNIFVNSKASRINSSPLGSSKPPSNPGDIIVTASHSYVAFTVPFKASVLGIYDIHGRLVEKLPVANNMAIWHGSNATGRYFVKPLDGKQNVVKAFVVVR
jgi:hypothetical protein